MMKKRSLSGTVIKIILISIVVLPFFIPMIMRWMWSIDDVKPLSVFILDKTVINKPPQEHLSLSWVLTRDKYVKPNNELHSPELDYFGFFPDGEGDYKIQDIEKYTSQQIDSTADAYDMAYYTDTYGIYRVEWEAEYPQINPKQPRKRIGSRSSLMYGGLSKKELRLLQAFRDRKKLIINEFNIIASPTSGNIRREYEEEFGFRWSGWTGRYFNDLDTTTNGELPRWLVNNYKDQNEGRWPFKRSGIVFVSTSDSIAILENKTHLSVEVPIIHTDDEFLDYYDVIDHVHYPFWFDVIYTSKQNQVISKYKVYTTSEGDSVLKRWKLPKEFPAVLRSKTEYPFFYFAGDFADNPITMRRANHKYIEQFRSFLYKRGTNERGVFFWRFYHPIMSKILDDYYRSLDEDEIEGQAE